MEKKNRQLVGTIASAAMGGKDSIFVNNAHTIQFVVQSLLVSDASTATGYLSNFDDRDIAGVDSYAADDDQIDQFHEAVDGKLFIYTYREKSNGFINIQRIDMTPKPPSFNPENRYYPIPVFSSRDDMTLELWNNPNWNFHRSYSTLEEFLAVVQDGGPLGSTFGYYPDDTPPAFVVWKTEKNEMIAIGNISELSNDALGAIVIHTDPETIFRLPLDHSFVRSSIFAPDINPSLMFVPEDMYNQVQNELLKKVQELAAKEEEERRIAEEKRMAEEQLAQQQAALAAEVEETVPTLADAMPKAVKTMEITEPSTEELVDRDTSKKTDHSMIDLMEYHSQRRNLYYSKKDLINFHTAMKTGDLVILSGLSGTGKSALVDVYARALGINTSANSEDSRMLFVPVRPSWNDDSDLLGYIDLVHMVYHASESGFLDFLIRAQLEENKDKIFLVCFDEMNLARVEHYFSQFLSILEQPESQRMLQLYDQQYEERLYNSAKYPSRIAIGDNIHFVGTVNIDETTYHFSDKVLDRANVIELSVLNYATEWSKKPYESVGTVTWTNEDYKRLVKSAAEKHPGELHSFLWDLHTLFQGASTKYGVGPRVVKSIDKYLANLPQDEDWEDFGQDEGLDYQVGQRILTKLRGPENIWGEILSRDSEHSIYKVLDKYGSLSRFAKSREIVGQKYKELETYGYCI